MLFHYYLPLEKDRSLYVNANDEYDDDNNNNRHYGQFWSEKLTWALSSGELKPSRDKSDSPFYIPQIILPQWLALLFFSQYWSKNNCGVKVGLWTKKLQEIHDATCGIHYEPMKKLSSYDQHIVVIILLLVRKLESSRDPLQVTKPLIWYCFCKKERQRVNSRQRRKTSNSENSK